MGYLHPMNDFLPETASTNKHVAKTPKDRFETHDTMTLGECGPYRRLSINSFQLIRTHLFGLRGMVSEIQCPFDSPLSTMPFSPQSAEDALFGCTHLFLTFSRASPPLLALLPRHL